MRGDSTVTLLSYRSLTSSEVRRQESHQKQRLSWRSLINKILTPLTPRRKKKERRLKEEQRLSEKRDAEMRNIMAQTEIERFHRDFVLPLELWSSSSTSTSSQASSRPEKSAECDVKSDSSSCFDSGHFSELSSDLSSSLQPHHGVDTDHAPVLARPGHQDPLCSNIVTVNGVCFSCQSWAVKRIDWNRNCVNSVPGLVLP